MNAQTNMVGAVIFLVGLALTYAIEAAYRPVLNLGEFDLAFALALFGALPILIWGHWHAYVLAVSFLTVFMVAVGVVGGIGRAPIELLVWAVGFSYTKQPEGYAFRLDLVPRWIARALLWSLGVTILLPLPLMGLWQPTLNDPIALRWVSESASYIILALAAATLIVYGAQGREPTRPVARVTFAPESGVFVPRRLVMALGHALIGAGLVVSAVALKRFTDMLD